MRTAMPKTLGMMSLGLALLAGTGCENLTRSRFEMVSVNVSTREDVRHTLGPPSYVMDGRWQFERPERHINVLIDFDERGVVTRKQWIDANTGEWADSKPAGDESSREKTTVRTIK